MLFSYRSHNVSAWNCSLNHDVNLTWRCNCQTLLILNDRAIARRTYSQTIRIIRQTNSSDRQTHLGWYYNKYVTNRLHTYCGTFLLQYVMTSSPYVAHLWCDFYLNMYSAQYIALRKRRRCECSSSCDSFSYDLRNRVIKRVCGGGTGGGGTQSCL